MASHEQIEFYDNFVEYFDKNKDNHRNSFFRNWSSKWIKDGQKVLDFGCALGYNSLHLTKNPVIGIDLSPKCIEVANERSGPLQRYFSGDITEGFDPEARDFDWVMMSDVIEHIPLEKHPRLFKTLAEWTKPGGCIIASLPNESLHHIYSKTSKQPVEEPVKIYFLLEVLHSVGFIDVISLFLEDNLYYKIIVRKEDKGKGNA